MSEMLVAVLTGGAQGLGAAICEVLLNNGYRVCVSDVLEEKGKEFVNKQQQKYGAENVKFVECDVTKEDDYEKLFQFAIKEFKKIDLVLNNAGVVLEHNPKKAIDVNLMGPIIGCKLALKYLGKSNGGKGGMVINTASIAGFIPLKSVPIYVASKHGIIGLTRSYGLPYHLERDGVLFTAICPSFINTEMLQKGLTNTLIQGLDAMKTYADEIMQFVNNCRNPLYKNVGPVCASELQGAELFLVKSVQSLTFSEEIKYLQTRIRSKGHFETLRR